jgi:hypothetical protein
MERHNPQREVQGPALNNDASVNPTDGEMGWEEVIGGPGLGGAKSAVMAD